MKTAIVMFSATSLSTRWLHSSYRQRCKHAMSGKNWIARSSGSCQTNFVIKKWNKIHMWQSHVEIEGYSVAYFDRIAAFKAPYHWTSIKGGAHMRFVEYSCIYEARMSSALNESSAIWCFKHSKAIEIRNGITFDFYMGLPQLWYLKPEVVQY